MGLNCVGEETFEAYQIKIKTIVRARAKTATGLCAIAPRSMCRCGAL